MFDAAFDAFIIQSLAQDDWLAQEYFDATIALMADATSVDLDALAVIRRHLEREYVDATFDALVHA